MNKKKPSALSNVTERDKKLMFILGTILVLALSYFFVFSPNQKKADEVKTLNKEKKAYVTELDGKIANEPTKRAEITTFRNDRETILAKFPGGMTHEKAIKILADLEKDTDIFSSQVALAVNNIFFNQAEARTNNVVQVKNENIASTSSVAVVGVAEETYPDIVGYKTVLTLSFNCQAEELTKALDFINGYEDKMSVEDITVGFDETTGGLIGTMNLCMFAVEGVDNEYEEPTTEGVDLGVVNIFGSKKSTVKKKK